jgi:hypothetical protein
VGRIFRKTALSPDLRVQNLVATPHGALIDLAWEPPDFDTSTRQLIGYELFRDDTSTRPPSRLTWKTMPGAIHEARGLEVLPHSEYGVQPIWRMFAADPPAAIEFGPARLANGIGGPGNAVVMPDERIRPLAWLQRDGLITSSELELAIEELLGTRAQPAPEPEIATAAARTSASAKKPTRVLAAGLGVVLLLLAVAVAGPSLGRLLFAQQSAVRISPATSPSPVQPSPSPTGRPLNIRPVLIKASDLRSGYVAGPYDSSFLCSACDSALSSVSVVLQNRQFHRTVISAAAVAPSAGDSSSLMQALMTSLSSGQWSKGKGLGDESQLLTSSTSGTTSFYVVWRSGVVVDEIVLSGPKGGITLQNAIDLAKLQQVRTAAIHA